MTPWVPIAIALLLTVGPSLVVWRFTGRVTLAVSTGLLILALASFALGTIATVAFVWGGLLLLGALIGLGVAWSDRKRSNAPPPITD